MVDLEQRTLPGALPGKGAHGSLPPGVLQTVHVLTLVGVTRGCAYAKINAAKHLCIFALYCL